MPRSSLLIPRPRFAPSRAELEETSLTDSLRQLLMPARATDRRRRRDRRATTRLEIDLPCTLTGEHGEARHRTVDLATFGASVEDGPTHPPGTRVTFRLLLPEAGSPLEVEAVVIDVDPAGRMRLAFRNAPQQCLRRLHRFLYARTSGR